MDQQCSISAVSYTHLDVYKRQVLTAFYTPQEITDTLADVLADYSVRPDRVLEPSAGVGAFVDAVLRHRDVYKRQHLC